MAPRGDGSGEVVVQASEPEVVATAHERRQAGLDLWVDGTMGIHRFGGSALVVAPNGPRLARHLVPSGAVGANLIGGVQACAESIRGLPADVDHASGGALYRDGSTGLLLLLYHGERFLDGDAEDFYSFLGMSVSGDDGWTFHDLGPVITSELGEHDPRRSGPVELGPGSLVRRGDDFLLYFHDRSPRIVRRNLSVASAPVEAVLRAARRGQAPEFHKWNGVGFLEPGIGGTSAELFELHRGWIAWYDVLRLENLGMLAVVYSTIRQPQAPQRVWSNAITFSEDGLTWSDPVLFGEDPTAREMLYLTVDSGSADQHVSHDGRFDLYRNWCTTPFRWDDARLERIRVEVGAGSVCSDG